MLVYASFCYALGVQPHSHVNQRSGSFTARVQLDTPNTNVISHNSKVRPIRIPTPSFLNHLPRETATELVLCFQTSNDASNQKWPPRHPGRAISGRAILVHILCPSPLATRRQRSGSCDQFISFYQETLTRCHPGKRTNEPKRPPRRCTRATCAAAARMANA